MHCRACLLKLRLKLMKPYHSVICMPTIHYNGLEVQESFNIVVDFYQEEIRGNACSLWKMGLTRMSEDILYFRIL